MDLNCRPDSEPSPKTRSMKAKTKCLISILMNVALMGLLDGILPEDSHWITVMDVVFGLIANIFILVWCYLDSEERNFTISTYLSIIIFLFWPVGLLYYLSKTRKGWPVLITLCLAALFGLIAGCVYDASFWLGSYLYDRFYF
ncbi:MAG: hypothetical protein ABFD91_16845 [Anaerohalosphaeraceae bacterium]